MGLWAGNRHRIAWCLGRQRVFPLLLAGVAMVASPAFGRAQLPAWEVVTNIGGPPSSGLGAGFLRSLVPSPGSLSTLSAMTCVRAADCWAVGDFRDRFGVNLNEALRWNGKSWLLVATPNPGGRTTSDGQVINGVACVSAADCWAVGDFITPGGATLNEALHWNGKRWSKVTSPNPGGTALNIINGVACIRAADCWAVGEFQNSAGATLNEALHWNGQKWSNVAGPNPGGTASSSDTNVINGVACVSAADCWAVGDVITPGGATLNEALHWNGKRWSKVASANPGGTAPGDQNIINGVACVRAADCWAVGYLTNSTTQLNEALHWNGKKWSKVTVPNPGSPQAINGVACVKAADCWAVGDFENTAGATVNEALHWNGKKWSNVSTLNPGGTALTDTNVIHGVACVRTADCWAVGGFQNAAGVALNEALHWDGKTWSSA
jgi:hypothetical protein